MRILVAEDETIIRLDLVTTLRDAGFDVCGEARNGEEAVELAARERPDLAILDVKMPRVDGIEAARRILAELVERLRATLVQGVGAGKRVESRVEPVSLHGGRATALALVFSELLQNALEHGGDRVQVELARRNGDVCLTVADDGSWSDDAVDGTGLSIVRALVRDELNGRLSLAGADGLRAEVVFPA